MTAKGIKEITYQLYSYNNDNFIDGFNMAAVSIDIKVHHGYNEVSSAMLNPGTACIVLCDPNNKSCSGMLSTDAFIEDNNITMCGVDLEYSSIIPSLTAGGNACGKNAARLDVVYVDNDYFKDLEFIDENDDGNNPSFDMNIEFNETNGNNGVIEQGIYIMMKIKNTYTVEYDSSIEVVYNKTHGVINVVTSAVFVYYGNTHKNAEEFNLNLKSATTIDMTCNNINLNNVLHNDNDVAFITGDGYGRMVPLTTSNWPDIKDCSGNAIGFLTYEVTIVNEIIDTITIQVNMQQE
ncbi:MAG: hypothetical protein J6D03_06955 [Clostridia bacterium]|nr:hypothetical protein [Clostridia bacterium]